MEPCARLVARVPFEPEAAADFVGEDTVVVERPGACNHFAAPLLRLVGMPWCSLGQDLVTVLDSDAPLIATRLKLATAAPARVFLLYFK